MRRLAILLICLWLPQCASAQTRVGILGGTVPTVPLPVGPAQGAPAIPSAPSPSDVGVDVAITPVLRCLNDGSSFIIKFGTVNPPTVATAIGPLCSYTTATLSYSTTYYWQIIASNSFGQTTGPIWRFTTLAAPSPPGTPCSDPSQNSPTGRNPTLIWTCARQGIYNQEYSDYLANPSSPATQAGRWFAQMRLMADAPNGTYYEDVGQWDALLYQMTGDANWVTKAWPKIAANYLAQTPDPNYDRIFSTIHIIMLDWLWPGLSGTQRTQLLDAIAEHNRWAIQTYQPYTFSCGAAAFCIPYGDSDQITGQMYFPVTLLHLTHPENAVNENLWTNYPIGGLDATASNNHSTLRNALEQYLTQMALGGEWIEAGEYNPGTVMYFLTGMEAVKTATGVDHFPNMTTLIPKFAERMINNLTPDLNNRLTWGEEEHPHQQLLRLFSMTEPQLAGLLQGTTMGQQIQQHILDLTTKYGEARVVNNEGMGPYSFEGEHSMMLWNPYAAVTDWKTVSPLFYSSGEGTLNFHSGWTASDSHFFFHRGPTWNDPTTGGGWVDHNVRYMDFQLYKNGEWVISHPFGYTASNSFGEGANNLQLNNLGEPWEYRETQAVASGTTYAYSSATAGGSFFPKTYYLPAPINTHEQTRGILFVKGTTDTIIVHDRAYATAIASSADDADRYLGVFPTCLVTDSLGRKQWVLHMPVSPTVSSNTVSWTTVGTSQAVKLTSLLPATQTITTYHETDWDGVRCGWGGAKGGNFLAGEHLYNVQIAPNPVHDFDTFLNVIQVGTPGTVTLKSDSNAEGAHVTRTGQSDILAMFNAVSGTTLSSTHYDAAHRTYLDSVRLRSTGYSITWTASGSSTDVYLTDLNPSTTWKKNVDGAGAVTITPGDCVLATNGCGFVTFSVSGSGVHTLVVTN